MTGDEIITGFIGRLDYHLLANNIASVHQEAYKNDFFKLFREAFRGNHIDGDAHPKLTADALRDVLQERWNSINTPQGKDVMERVLGMWHEWGYAWAKRP